MRRKGIVRAARRTSRALSWPRIPCDAVAPLAESQSNRQSQEQGGHPRPPAAEGGHPPRPLRVLGCFATSAPQGAAHFVGCRALRAHSHGCSFARSASKLGELIAMRWVPGGAAPTPARVKIFCA